METKRFTMPKNSMVIQLVAGVFTLFISGLMALVTPVLVSQNAGNELWVIAAVILAIAWLNLGWVCRTLGVLIAKQPPEVVVSDDGIFARTVRRGGVVNSFRPKNAWEERVIAWDEFQGREQVWHGNAPPLQGGELKIVRLHQTGAPPLDLNESVFGKNLLAIDAAITAEVGEKAATMANPPPLASDQSTFFGGRKLKMVFFAAWLAVGCWLAWIAVVNIRNLADDERQMATHGVRTNGKLTAVTPVVDKQGNRQRVRVTVDFTDQRNQSHTARFSMSLGEYQQYQTDATHFKKNAPVAILYNAEDPKKSQLASEPIGSGNGWGYAFLPLILGCFFFYPVYALVVTWRNQPEYGVSPTGIVNKFPFVRSGGTAFFAVVFFGIFWLGTKLRAYRYQWCGKCHQHGIAVQRRFFNAFHLYFIPVLPLGFSRWWHCAKCDARLPDKPDDSAAGAEVPHAASDRCPVCTGKMVTLRDCRCSQCDIVRLEA